MGYLLTEIVVYLVIAGLIGFAFGWLVRDGRLDKYFDKVIELMKKSWVIILASFGTIKSYFSNLEIFKKSTKTEETKESVESKEEVKEIVETKENVTEVAEIAKEEVELKVEKAIKEEPKVEKLEVAEEAVAEITKEVEAEVTSTTTEEVVEVIVDSTKPTLLTEAPAEGQDKLSSLKGLGPVMEKKLNELGIYTFAQMASWSSEQALWIGTALSSPNKVIKEEWVAQSKELLENK